MENNLGNKKTMASNIKYYMLQKGVSATEVCKALEVPESTFSYWLNCKTYPRIDKIEKMAAYFNITKADLVEERKQLNYYEKIGIQYFSENKEPSEHVEEFSDEERELVKMFRMVKPEERAMVLSMIRAALSSQK